MGRFPDLARHTRYGRQLVAGNREASLRVLLHDALPCLPHGANLLARHGLGNERWRGWVRLAFWHALAAVRRLAFKQQLRRRVVQHSRAEHVFLERPSTKG